MEVTLCEQSAAFIPAYAAIPIAFEVREHLALERVANGLGGILLHRRTVEHPYVKDYDALPGQRPAEWHRRWDLSKWQLCAAFHEGQIVGGIAIVLDASEVLGPAADVCEAVIYDVRVRPEYRKHGVGKQLLDYAAGRASAAGKERLSVETQNNNVAACHLYAACGFSLRSIDRLAYPAFPYEVQLVWGKQLDRPRNTV